MERLSKKSDRPYAKKATLALVMIACMLAMVFVPVAVSEDGDADPSYYGGITWNCIRDNSAKTLVIQNVQENTSSVENLVVPYTLKVGAEDFKVVGFNTSSGWGDNSKVKTISFSSSFQSTDVITLTKMSEFTHLETLELPSCIVNINSGVFWNNTCLKSVSGGTTVTVGDNAFKGCTALQSVTSSITTIGASAFSGCTALTELTSQSISTIGSEAFSGCKSLESVDTTGVTVIQDSTFDGCKKLKSVKSSAFTSIGKYAFRHCEALTTFEIGSSVSSIGVGAFAACKSLTGFTGGSMAYQVVEGILYEPNGVKFNLKAYPAGLQGAVTVDENVVMILEEAFAGCDKITSVALPLATSEIMTKAFYACNSLDWVSSFADSLKLSGTDTFIKTNDGTKKVTELRVLKLTDSTGTEYQSEAKPDAGSKYMKLTTEEDWLYSVADDKATIYGYLGNGSDVRIPNEVGGYPVDVVDISVVKNPGAVTSIDFGHPSVGAYSKVTKIAAGSFDLFTNLKEINIPDSVTSIGFNTIGNAIGAKNLEVITVHTDNKNYKAYNGVLYSYTEDDKKNTVYTLVACPAKLTSVDIPTDITVVAIGSNALNGCAIKEFTIPATVTSIGSNAFENCESLVTVNGTGTVSMEIGEYAFNGCTALKTFAPKNVTVIGNNAFFGCKALQGIDLTKTTSIGDFAFFGCKSVTKFTIGSSLASIGNGTFGNCSSVTAFEGKSSKYSTEDGILYEIITNSQRELVVCPMTKSGSITIPNNVTKIQDYGFFGCDQLVTVELPDSMTTIGDLAFFGCNKLELVVCWSELTVDETSNGTFKKTNTVGTKIVTDLRCPGQLTILGEGEKPQLDIGARHMEIKQLGANVYCYLKSVSPYYDLYIVVHGSGSDKSIKFTDTITNPFAGDWAKYKLNIKHVYETGGVTNIPDDMFSGFEMLQTVSGFESATTVGSYAFKDCVSLKTLNLPKVTSIGANAFGYLEIKNEGQADEKRIIHGCLCLETISIPAIKTIGAQAFFGCSNLKSIDLNSTVTEIADETFKGCTHLVTATMPGVKTIGTSAFEGCVALETVSAAALTTVGEKAFLGCAKLKTISQSAVTTVNTNAFEGCAALTELKFEKVTTIETEAFKDCSSLKTITINTNAKEVKLDAFDGCISLEKFVVSGTGGAYSAEDGVLIYTVKEGNAVIKTLVCFPKAVAGSYTVPDGIMIIGAHALKDSVLLTEIIISSGVTEIRDEAFMDCTGLKKIDVWGLTTEPTVGKDVFIKTIPPVAQGADPTYGTLDVAVYASTSVASKALMESKTEKTADYGTTPLYTNVYQMDQCGQNIYAFVSEDGKVLQLVGYGDMYPQAKKDNWNLVETIEIDDRITSIGSYAFKELKITSIALPSSLKTIGEGAFMKCELLTKIDIPSNVTAIGDCAFYGCGSLDAVNFATDSKLESIGMRAFEGTLLTSFTIPTSLKTMGDNPFVKTEIKSVTNLSENFVITDGILYDKGKTRIILCFVDYKGDYNMPVTVTGIDSYAFDHCVNIKSVSFPEGLKTIGENAFNGCVSLGSVLIPFGELETIGSGAFTGCTGLKEITLPESVKEIGMSAFSGCTGVQIAILKCLIDADKGKSVTIGNKAFYSITPENIYATKVLKTKIELSGIQFGQIQKLIPCGGSVYAYEEYVSGYGYYILHIIGEGAMDDKYDWSWENKGTILKVVIMPKVTKLGTHVFEGLTSLNNVVIPENITAIPDYAFAGCTSLVNIDLNDKITSIGMEAFSGCTSLTGTVTFDTVPSTLIIPKAVTSIGYKAFYECSSLSKIILDCNATLAQQAFPGDYSAMLDDKGVSKDSLYTFDGTKWNYMDRIVQWKVEGEVVQTDRVHDGADVPAYKGATPTKAADKQYYYTFANWTPDMSVITKDTVFTAVFLSTIQKYDITYTDPTSTSKFVDNAQYGVYYLKDNMLTAPAGKIFSSWKVDGVEKDARSMITLDKNTTVEAVWIDNYTITYDAGLHGTGTIASVKTTGDLTLPGALSYTAEAGWQFKGWDVGGTIYDADAKIKVTKSQTITAIWEGKHVITYKAGTYGTGADYTDRFPLSVTFADSKFQPQTEQYYFLGWNCNGVFFEAGDVLEIGVDITAVAEWGIKKTVTYDNNGGLGSMNVDFAVSGSTYQLKANAFTAPYAYAFKGWDVNGTLMQPGQVFLVEDDTVVKATWELGIPVSFDANGGTGVMYDVYVLKDSYYMPGECKFDAPEGKAFRIWTVNIQGLNADVVNPVFINAPTTFIAAWVDLIPVTIDPNGAEGYEDVEYVLNSFTFKEIDDYWIWAPEGQAFYAWDLDGVEYQPGQTISVDKAITVKAVWKNYYTLSFDANGGTGTMDSIQTFGTVTVSQCGFTAPAGDPMVFKNWDLNGTAVKAGETITIAENTVLKAVWIPAYTVTFAANGGTGEMAPVNASGDYELPECGFEPATEREAFIAWILPDGTAALPGTIIDVTGDMTVTASWLSANSVSVSANSYGTASADYKYALPGMTITLTATPNAGCDFVSWEVSPSTVKIVNDKFEMPEADVTVKAIFKVHVDTEISASCDFGSVSLPIDSEITSKCSIKLSMYKIVSPKQSNIPKDATVYSIGIEVYNGTQKVSLDGKTATVFIAYKLAAGEKTDDLKVFYVSDDGKTVENMNATYDAVKGGMVFTTTHFSDFVITHEDIKPLGMDYMPIILAVVIMVLIVMFALLLAWRHKLNNC